MDSEDGEFFIKQLATFVRTHEKALANALQFQRQSRHRPSQSTSAATLPPLPVVSERPSTSSSTTGSLAAALSLGNLSFTSHNVKSAKLALTPHHLFYLLSRFEDLGISVGPMKIRLENLHDSASSANYVSFLSGSNQRSRTRSTDATSIHSVSSVRSVMSGMSSLWASLGIGSSISAARTERQKAALEADMKYLYSAFTKIPCLKLAPDWRARLIRGYEEFPFDSAVPLYAFKNLQALEVNSIDFRQFFGWDRMADQLRSLTLRHAGIEDPADILIDIVLDDMDKRRRRTSKAQSSPTTTWGANSPRRSPSLVHPELSRSASLPCSSDPRAALADLRIGSLTPPDASDIPTSPKSRPILNRKESEDYSKSPTKSPAKFSRPRSISPSRPTTSRTNTRNSQRITRSGSGSSHSSLSESWYHHHTRGSSGNLLAMGILPASKWRFLRHLSLADNAMTTIPPTSLAPLSNTLYSLDLSSNLFNQVPESLATLTALRALNLSHCMIDSLHSLTRNPLPAITALNLRANRLQSLAGIERLYPLERLDLRDNRLGDPKELARLTGIPEIREIWVEGNPFTRVYKDYRVTIFNLFRATPGYTEDVMIDGNGPTYAEKRLLTERVPIPDSVPVVKPAPVVVPAVDISKPAVIQGPREPAVLRKERPVAKAVTSEASSSSRRRRKTPKRRIVDLATRDGSPLPVASEGPADKSSGTTTAAVTKADDGNPDMSPKRQLLPPVVLSPHQSEFAPILSTQATIRQVESQPDRSGDSEWTPPSDWDASGDYYRRKIEALRNTVGEGYLSALSEESWESTHGFDVTGLSNVASLRAGHLPHHVPAVQAVHSGRTLG
ncbi:hypothetical protein V2A60_005370 [Cordyceps javanica]|uniref:Leucine rich repeat protein n=1 Tax=Cordyceps javanica TaxID=43265 RepID=A0A545VE26_9HYPO|nr:leucine rich repeat protein [Cordyceps javanica]TQW10373.1 leucine rich repeat protein [Cordyceps javanica]